MDEYAKKKLEVLLRVLTLAACVALVLGGQRSIGPLGLGKQLLGLAGILALLWVYNKPFQG